LVGTFLNILWISHWVLTKRHWGRSRYSQFVGEEMGGGIRKSSFLPKSTQLRTLLHMFLCFRDLQICSDNFWGIFSFQKITIHRTFINAYYVLSPGNTNFNWSHCLQEVISWGRRLWHQ
jgi:hypothetical protein